MLRSLIRTLRASLVQIDTEMAEKYAKQQVRCNLQVTLCDPYLSALSVRYYNIGAI